MKQAVILAGGKGTRLKDRLNGLPKPLIDLCGIPLLERQVLLCKRHGISQILILVNHEADQIRNFCAGKNNWDLDILCLDDGKPRGTAGAVLAAYSHLADECVVLYGDTMLDVDLERFWNFHHAQPTSATLFLHPNDHPYDSDIVDADENGIIHAFHPYPHKDGSTYPNLVNAALYVIQKSALRPWVQDVCLLDFGKDLFPLMLKNGLVLRGYNSPEYIKDCGTPDRIDRVCADFRSGRIAKTCLSQRQQAVFLDRDGTINRDIKHLARAKDFELLDGVAGAIHRLNRSFYRTVVVTNQPVIARGECSLDEMRHIHNKMETLLGYEHAYLDRIYYCPHHPDKGFPGEVIEYKKNCECRKPGTGMLKKAERDLNIQLSASWMIGDATADILAARQAGVTSILVETGVAGLDNKYNVMPDFVSPNLADAVSFILDDYPVLDHWANEWTRELPSGALIFIGGLSRSGKTTLAHVLERNLREKSRKTVILSLDRWLLSAKDRRPGVMGRYDITALRALVERLAGRRDSIKLDLAFYDKIHRQRIEKAETVTINPEDIVIFEGTIALCFEEGLKGIIRTIHVDAEEELRHKLFLREYVSVRGYDIEESERLYQSRLLDEVPLIMELSAKAQHRLNVPFHGVTKYSGE